MLTIIRRNFGLNCMLKQELRRHDPRSRFPPNSPFRAHFRAFYPHPANKSSLRAEGAAQFLATGKRGWPATSPWSLICRYLRWPLFSRSAPHAFGRELASFFRSIPPSFVLSHNMSMVNTTSNWLRFGAFLSPSSLPFQFHWPLATVLVPPTTLLSLYAPCRRTEIGFVFRLDSAFVRPKSQYVND